MRERVVCVMPAPTVRGPKAWRTLAKYTARRASCPCAPRRHHSHICDDEGHILCVSSWLTRHHWGRTRGQSRPSKSRRNCQCSWSGRHVRFTLSAAGVHVPGLGQLFSIVHSGSQKTRYCRRERARDEVGREAATVSVQRVEFYFRSS